MLQLYSDCSVGEGVAFATTLVLKDKSIFLTLFCQKYEGNYHSTNGEILAVLQSIEWVAENYPLEKELQIYCDNTTVCDLFARAKIPKSHPYKDLWNKMFSLCSRFDSVVACYTPAHLDACNPNKTCDVLCSAISRLHKGRVICMQ